MKTTTIPPTAPSWILVDAEGQTLGRLAATIAHRLRGKHRVHFSPHLLCGDQVVVINTQKLSFPPNKLLQKTYYKHTGYFGHLRSTNLEKMMKENPERVLELAVKRMLPHNRLRPQMLKRLHIFAGTEHPYSAQKPSPITDKRWKKL